MRDSRDSVSRFFEDAADWARYHAEPVDRDEDGSGDGEPGPEEDPFCCRRRDCGCGGYNR